MCKTSLWSKASSLSQEHAQAASHHWQISMGAAEDTEKTTSAFSWSPNIQNEFDILDCAKRCFAHGPNALPFLLSRHVLFARLQAEDTFWFARHFFFFARLLARLSTRASQDWAIRRAPFPWLPHGTSIESLMVPLVGNFKPSETYSLLSMRSCWWWAPPLIIHPTIT